MYSLKIFQSLQTFQCLYVDISLLKPPCTAELLSGKYSILKPPGFYFAQCYQPVILRCLQYERVITLSICCSSLINQSQAGGRLVTKLNSLNAVEKIAVTDLAVLCELQDSLNTIVNPLVNYPFTSTGNLFYQFKTIQ